MVKEYIDFDNVILATEQSLFKEYYELKKQGIILDKMKYVQEYDWYDLLYRCEEIGEAFKVLKYMKDACILTRVYSLENEGVSKIKFLRDKGVKNEIILAPYLLKKSDVVNAYGNILIDDNLDNLDDWYEKGGIPIFFNKDDLDFDSKGNENKKYLKIKTLKEFKNIIY